jgi:hypothetical protein
MPLALPLPRVPAEGPTRRWAEDLTRALERNLETGTPVGLVSFGQIWGSVTPSPVPDGTTTVFTIPQTILMTGDGRPLATLIHGRDRLLYAESDPPTVGRWWLRQNPQRVVVGEPPLVGEYFKFEMLVGA